MYAINQRTKTLVEFKTKKEFNKEQGYWCDSARGIGKTLLFKEIHFTTAHSWVKKGYIHETLLYFDGNKIRRA